MKTSFGRAGFTLLEVVLAIMLVVIGVVSVVNVMSSGVYINQAVEGQVIALNLAQEKMEEIKNVVYADISSYAAVRASVGGDFANYEREVLVSGTPKKVTVNVYWPYKSQEMTVSLVTLLANTSP